MEMEPSTDKPPVNSSVRQTELTLQTPNGLTGDRWLIIVAVGLGSLMSSLDSSVVNIILPVVSQAFRTDVATIEWVVTVYLLVVSGLLLSFGRLGDMHGNKQVYIYGFGIFVVGSMLCGLSSTALMLISFRGLQAIGAAILFANSPALLTKNFPASLRGRVLGLQSMMIYIGLTIGPILGGWLTALLSWRAVFYINVPIGLAALYLSVRYIPHDAPAEHAPRFDLPGAGTFLAGLTMLLLGLNQGDVWGWTSWPELLLFAVSIVLLVLFVVIEIHTPSPMLDLHLFSVRQFSAATVSAVCNYISLNVATFLLPFYLIEGRGLNTATTGLILSAQPIIMAISAPLSGALSDRVGPRILGTLGMLVLGAGMFLLSRLGADASMVMVALGLAVVGLGTGVFIAPNSSALMGSAPRVRQGIASGILATARNMGMVLGVGLAGAVLAASTGTTVSQPGSGAFGQELFTAVGIGMLIAAAVALFGALTSSVRGSVDSLAQ